MNDFLKKRLEHINAGRPLPEKKKYRIPVISEKRAKKIAEEKEMRGDDDTVKQKWFAEQRPRLAEYCGCGCGQRTMKFNDQFCFSIAHVLPQKLFPSVQFHTEVWVSRAWACHTNMDNRSMDRWPLYRDWPEICRKVRLLEPLLTDKERKTKFFKKL
jgi:hypothetical protein